jgi:flagellar motor switch protein FliM
MRDGELVAVDLDASIAGTDGLMRIAVPVAVAQRLVGDEDRAERSRPLDAERLRVSGERIVVPVSVIVHETTISLNEATQLSEGDVIPLGKPVDDPMTVCVRGRPKFLAQTGTRAGRLAAKLLRPVAEAVA